MSFMDVQGGFGQNNFQNNLAQNSAMNQNQQIAMQQQQAVMAAQQQQLNNLYGPQGFGGQTAAYAGAGAAYGRNTGYYGDTLGLPPGQTTPAAQAGYGYNSIDAQAGGGINPNDPANIALYYQITQGGSPYSAYPSSATNPPQSSYGYGLTNTGGFAPPSQGFGAPDAASQAYFAAYPDVAASGMSAAQHYAQFGQKEGREGFGMSAYPSSVTNTPQSSYGYGLTSGGGFAAPSQGFGGQDAASQAYFEAYPDVAKSGMSAAQHFAQFGQAEGRNGFGLSAGTMAQGGNPSWFDAGAPGGGFNTYGMPGSGMVGSQSSANQFQAPNAAQQQYLDANPDVRDWARDHGLDPGAFASQHAQQYGNNEGRNTFGLTNANPNFQQGGGFGMGSAFDQGTYGGSTGNPAFSFDQRFPAGIAGGSAGFGGYPQQPMASDNMANQQQMISDLYKTLGIIDNAGDVTPGHNYIPSGNTLIPRDVQIGTGG